MPALRMVGGLCGIALTVATCWVLAAVAKHRGAQADSVLKHAGLFEDDDADG